MHGRPRSALGFRQHAGAAGDVLRAEKGFHLLADVAVLGLAYQHQGGVTTNKFLREHPLVVRNFVKSYIEAVHRLKSDRALGLKIAAKYLRLEDKDLLQRTYESSIEEKKLPAKQYPSADGIKTILDELALKDPKAKAAKPSDFIDARFVEEFDKSGYIDSLYGKKR
jgi:ABC-type nitrate/sulfonate/bicarbonate transport system substrate-binding protein